MSDSATSTPRPTTESTGPKYYAPKDKSCPFCGQAFTSSSLGRHLDLYIKPKNPKPADGIHNVDEIRQLRGGITRRQARNSTTAPTRKENSVPTAVSKDSAEDDVDSPVQPIESPSLNLGPGEKIRHKFNEPNWQATGVINNLPPRPALHIFPDRRRDVSRHIQQKTDFEHRQKMSEEWENGKAAELALKEVLQSVRDAHTRTTSHGLFDFDFFSVGFPGLCINILPTPTTIFSTTPYGTNESCPIHPPNQKHYDTLQRLVRDRISIYQRGERQRKQSQVASNNGRSAANLTPTSPLPTPPLIDGDPQRYLAHLAEAYMCWKGLVEKQKQEAWQLELLRNYTRASQAKTEMEKKLEAAQREIAQLKSRPWVRMGMDSAQYMSLAVKAYSTSSEIPNETAREMHRAAPDIQNWEYDRLLDKWRNVVRENRKAASGGMVAQRSLSTSSVTRAVAPASFNGGSTANSSLQVSPTTGTGPTGVLNTNMLSQVSSSTTTAASTAPTSDGMDEDGGDQMDAHGEDEDAEGDVDTEEVHENVLPQSHDTHHQNIHQHHLHQQNNQMHAQTPQGMPHQMFWDQGSLSRRSSHHSLGQHHQNMMSNHPSPLSMMPMDGIENHNDAFLGRGMAINMGNLQDTFSGMNGVRDG